MEIESKWYHNSEKEEIKIINVDSISIDVGNVFVFHDQNRMTAELLKIRADQTEKQTRHTNWYAIGYVGWLGSYQTTNLMNTLNVIVHFSCLDHSAVI